MPENELYHYGKLGMRWGIRNPSSQPSSGRRRSSAEKSKNLEPVKKSLKDMSDSELKDVINRLDLEKRYKQLTVKEKTPGQKFVESVLNDAAKQTTTKYVTMYMNKGVEAIMKSAVKKK